MRELKNVAIASIVREQQPPREAFIKRVMRVAGRGLRHLGIE